MNDINFVTLSGTVDRPCEYRKTSNGQQVLDVFLASKRTWKNKDGQPTEHTTNVKVTLWGDRANYWSAEGEGHLHVGDSILINGMLGMDFNKVKIDNVDTINVVNRVSQSSSLVVDADEPAEDTEFSEVN